MATSPPRFDKFRIYLVFESQALRNRNHYLCELEVCDDGCRRNKVDDVVKAMPTPKYIFHSDCIPRGVLAVSLGSKLYFFRGKSLVTVDCALANSTLFHSYDGAASSSPIIEVKECKSWKLSGLHPFVFAVAGKILLVPREFRPAEKGLTNRPIPTVQLYEPESNSWKTLPDPDFVSTEGVNIIDDAVDSGTSVYISTRVISTHIDSTSTCVGRTRIVSTSTCVGRGVFRMDLMKPPYEWQYWRSEPLPFSGSYKEGSWLAVHNLRDLVWSEDPSPPGMEDVDFIKYHHLVKDEHIVSTCTRDFINLGKGFFCTIVTGIDTDFHNDYHSDIPGKSSISIYFVRVQVFKIRRVKVYGDDGGLANSEKKLKRKLKTGLAHSKKHDKQKLKWKARLLYSSKYAFNSNCVNPLSVESFCIMKESSIAAAGRA